MPQVQSSCARTRTCVAGSNSPGHSPRPGAAGTSIPTCRSFAEGPPSPRQGTGSPTRPQPSARSCLGVRHWTWTWRTVLGSTNVSDGTLGSEMRCSSSLSACLE